MYNLVNNYELHLKFFGIITRFNNFFLPPSQHNVFKCAWKGCAHLEGNVEQTAFYLFLDLFLCVVYCWDIHSIFIQFPSRVNSCCTYMFPACFYSTTTLVYPFLENFPLLPLILPWIKTCPSSFTPSYYRLSLLSRLSLSLTLSLSIPQSLVTFYYMWFPFSCIM